MNSNVKNAGPFMNPSASALLGKTKAPALRAGGMTAKSNCPPSLPPVRVRVWIWGALQLPVPAHQAAGFPERDNEGSRALPRKTMGDKIFWKHLKPKKKEKT